MATGFRSFLLSFGLLLMRLAAAGMMAIGHGWPKMQNFEQYSGQFPGLFGLDQKKTLMLAIFGELICPALVALGFLTRLAALSTAITMVVAVCVAHAADPLFTTGASIVTTTDEKVHTGYIISQDAKEIVIATGGEVNVTVPRNEIVSQKSQGSKEMAVLFLIPFAALIFTGPGKVSVDGLLFRGKAATAEPKPSLKNI